MESLSRRWLRVAVLFWLATCIYLLTTRWAQIHWFSLGDTDDNMRMMQVRGLLNGQGWYDLKQYRLNPPEGFDMHWSRIVDLPIAGLILIARLFVSGGIAERFAIAIAPMLPLFGVIAPMAFVARKLIGKHAYLVALIFLPFAQNFLFAFTPTRIDHHGWQLAMLALLVAGLVDDRPRRGGIFAGFAIAASFSIGIELLPYLILGGGLLGLRWVLDADEAPRIRSFGVTLAVTIAFGYFVFGSYDNALARCDALTPVWLTTVLAAAAAAFALSWIKPVGMGVRFVAAILAGGVLLAFYALAWPQCVGRLEGVSPELQTQWLDNISEARPIYRQQLPVIVSVSTLPIIGLFGHAFAMWSRRRDRRRLLQWMPLAVLALVSTTLLLFQARVGAAAQLLSIPGTTLLALTLLPWFARQRQMIVRVIGIPVTALTLCGALPALVAAKLHEDSKNSVAQTSRVIAARCATLPALRPIALLPKGTMFTFVDFGPRLITVTHHNAIGGPYHRNGSAILDVQRAFGGTADEARAIMRRHAADYLLICPGLPESTIYKSKTPKGFYVQITTGKVPDWLTKVDLPQGSPFMLWRIKP
jgi:MFS family permease